MYVSGRDGEFQHEAAERGERYWIDNLCFSCAFIASSDTFSSNNAYLPKTSPRLNPTRKKFLSELPQESF